jgi:hypothetical protein
MATRESEPRSLGANQQPKNVSNVLNELFGEMLSRFAGPKAERSSAGRHLRDLQRSTLAALQKEMLTAESSIVPALFRFVVRNCLLFASENNVQFTWKKEVREGNQHRVQRIPLGGSLRDFDRHLPPLIPFSVALSQLWSIKPGDDRTRSEYFDDILKANSIVEPFLLSYQEAYSQHLNREAYGLWIETNKGKAELEETRENAISAVDCYIALLGLEAHGLAAVAETEPEKVAARMERLVDTALSSKLLHGGGRFQAIAQILSALEYIDHYPDARKDQLAIYQRCSRYIRHKLADEGVSSSFSDPKGYNSLFVALKPLKLNKEESKQFGLLKMRRNVDLSLDKSYLKAAEQAKAYKDPDAYESKKRSDLKDEAARLKEYIQDWKKHVPAFLDELTKQRQEFGLFLAQDIDQAKYLERVIDRQSQLANHELHNRFEELQATLTPPRFLEQHLENLRLESPGAAYQLGR